ncbi:MAG: probable membrane protein STY4873, partial [uncultured Sphingomonas sp.]
ALADLANDLQTDADTRARVEGWKEELLANTSVALWLDTLWQKGRSAIIAAARNPDAVMAGKLGEVLRSMGTTLERDPRIRGAVNQFVRRAVAGMAASYGGSIVKLVSDTIRGWDARTITSRLEQAVGRDLQYIRINGTLVGGLVGLVLHMVDTL